MLGCLPETNSFSYSPTIQCSVKLSLTLSEFTYMVTITKSAIVSVMMLYQMTSTIKVRVCK